MRETFPSKVNAEAKAVSRRKISDEDLKNRRDLRGKKIFTIDGADSKDFDDAENMPEEHRLILDAIESGNADAAREAADVHIARLKELVIRENVQPKNITD